MHLQVSKITNQKSIFFVIFVSRPIIEVLNFAGLFYLVPRKYGRTFLYSWVVKTSDYIRNRPYFLWNVTNRFVSDREADSSRGVVTLCSQFGNNFASNACVLFFFCLFRVGTMITLRQIRSFGLLNFKHALFKVLLLYSVWFKLLLQVSRTLSATNKLVATTTSESSPRREQLTYSARFLF